MRGLWVMPPIEFSVGQICFRYSNSRTWEKVGHRACWTCCYSFYKSHRWVNARLLQKQSDRPMHFSYLASLKQRIQHPWASCNMTTRTWRPATAGRWRDTYGVRSSTHKSCIVTVLVVMCSPSRQSSSASSRALARQGAAGVALTRFCPVPLGW